MREAWKLYWVWVVAALIMLAVQHFWPLSQMRELAIAGGCEGNGCEAFDLRPGGYTFEEAKAYLTALGEAGRMIYLNIQLMLDRVFPVLYVPVLFFGLIGLDAIVSKRGWGWLLAVFALATGFFDYMENNTIAAMLTAGPDGLTAEMAADASSWTLLKSIAMIIACAGLLLMFIRALPILLTRTHDDEKPDPVEKETGEDKVEPEDAANHRD